MPIQVIPLEKQHLPEAALLFSDLYRQLRQQVDLLPERFSDSAASLGVLRILLESSAGLAAVENGKLVGYLAWYMIDRFRNGDRRAAYCPEWAHAAQDTGKQSIYRALYAAAASLWTAVGCQMHALTLLAHDTTALQTWFWNGFGLLVVDAIRPATPLLPSPTSSLLIRPADVQDARLLSELDAEHWAYYHQPPILMPGQASSKAQEFEAFLARPKNSIWLAWDGDTPAGFLRCDGYECDGVAILESEQTFFISGAYLRPTYRGRGAGAAMLDAALRANARLGFTTCAVNFESFNPEAARFWPKHFQPVGYSLLRMPELTVR